MKYKNYILVILALALVSAGRQSAAMTNYYAATNGPHQPPFDTWEKAASNIQNVITLARNGDVINLSNGTFVVTGMLDVAYAVTIRGEYGQDQTILTGAFPDYTNRCFDVRHDNAWLVGLTISNFHVNGNAGGVWLQRGNMHSCHITHNHVIGANRWAGGIKTEGTWTGLVTHCRISYNTNTNQFGGGIALSGAAPTGGIIRNCEIYGNYGHQAGGVFIYDYGLIDQCVIRDNISGSSGGGISGSANSGSNTMVRNSLIVGNVATGASGIGGGILKGSNTFSLVNCNIVSNYATSYGGGLALGNDSLPNRQVIINTIVYSNQALGSQDVLVYAASLHQTNWFFNCCVGTLALPAHQGNFTNNPVFINPDPANPDYRLLVNSPCVNAGTNHPALGALDLDGHTRVDRFRGMVDIGCYEYIARGSLFSAH